MKKLVLLAVLALQFLVAANFSVDHAPWPTCFPCDRS